MPNPESSLPAAWVERIFAVMRANYGASFDRQWECPAGEDLASFAAQLKGVWGRELARFQQSPKAIENALESLPPHPPTLPEFRALCQQAATRGAPLLNAPLPPFNPALVAHVAQGLQRLRGAGDGDDRAWARRLKARHARGERLTLAQVQAYEEALR